MATKDFYTREEQLILAAQVDQYGYEGFLYSRGAINFGRASSRQRLNGLMYRERYMVRSTFAGFQTQILRLCVKGVVRR